MNRIQMWLYSAKLDNIMLLINNIIIKPIFI